MSVLEFLDLLSGNDIDDKNCAMIKTYDDRMYLLKDNDDEKFTRNKLSNDSTVALTSMLKETCKGYSGFVSRGFWGNPVNTGTSVLAIKFDGGVAMAADTLASFGSMARYGKVSRIYDVNQRTLLGVSGDYADFQFLKRHLQAKIMDDERLNESHEFNPSALYNWLSCVLYDRRSEFNPLFNQYIIGGLNKSNGQTKPFLGTVNKLGVTYESAFIVSGLGNFMVQQILENEYKKAKAAKPGETLLNKKEAVELLKNCMTIMFYRDARAHSKFDIGVVTEDGAEIIPQEKIIGDWSIAKRNCQYFC